jgi:hypothetical protein
MHHKRSLGQIRLADCGQLYYADPPLVIDDPFTVVCRGAPRPGRDQAATDSRESAPAVLNPSSEEHPS